MTVDSEKLLKTDEVASILRCDRHTIYKLRDLGVLVPMKLTRSDLYRYDAIERFIEDGIGKDFTDLNELSPKGAQDRFGVYR